MIAKAITYEGLHTSLRKGIRNGNWRHLNLLDKALYRASMWYVKHRCIVNGTLVTKLVAIIEKLKETKGMRIFKRGFEKAVEMLEKGEKNGNSYSQDIDEELVSKKV